MKELCTNNYINIVIYLVGDNHFLETELCTGHLMHP